MKYGVFIQTNHKQIVGALVAEHAIRRYSRHNDAFDVTIMHTRDYPFFAAREGQLYLRDGVKRVWLNDDLQSFTPTRFLPPELMGYEGRAVVIDPDIFAAADVWELLSRDMGGKAILCRMRSGPKGFIDGMWASSVMLLDCAKLTHWQVEKQFNAMFSFEIDYQPWIGLRYEDQSTIGVLENEWNDFDRFTRATKMLHTTRRKTQPWKTGLPTDWRPAERFRLFPPIGWLMRARRHLFGEYGLLGTYKPHPDPNQEAFFFGLLKECILQGKISEEFLRREMAQNHVRHDAFEVLDRTPDLPPPDRHPLEGALRLAS
ncbi:MAG: hypothetical protein KatS3mg124_0355 [Porticoccaceae bacterium]|nr:MAG: hypothetical protein KatS3mg124_0355 [Porticoccaceae bacterium]